MSKDYMGEAAIRPLERLMTALCHRKGYDYDTVFKGFLDYLLWMFDPDGNKPDGWKFGKDESMAFGEMARAYFLIMKEQTEKLGWYDAFGDLYMSLHSNGGGKGQFFTPPSVCMATAQTCIRSGNWDDYGRTWATTQTTFGRRVTISDPAAGSSRLLLAGNKLMLDAMRDEAKWDAAKIAERRPYLVAEDLDYNCVKMSAINMMMHNCFGEAVCHDTLCEPDEVRLGYIINEAMWPFPTNIPSIRKYTNPMRFVSTRMWAVRRMQNEKEAEPKQEHGKVDRKDAAAVQPIGEQTNVAEEKKKQPQQLTLW